MQHVAGSIRIAGLHLQRRCKHPAGCVVVQLALQRQVPLLQVADVVSPAVLGLYALNYQQLPSTFGAMVALFGIELCQRAPVRTPAAFSPASVFTIKRFWGLSSGAAPHMVWQRLQAVAICWLHQVSSALCMCWSCCPHASFHCLACRVGVARWLWFASLAVAYKFNYGSIW